MKNKGKANSYTTKWQAKNPQATIFHTKKSHAKQNGIAFTLSFSDMVWPTHCPALGTKLEYVAGDSGRGRRSDECTPSFDRLDPSKGYTPENTVIISKMANNIKSHATAEQVRLVSLWLGRTEYERRE